MKRSFTKIIVIMLILCTCFSLFSVNSYAVEDRVTVDNFSDVWNSKNSNLLVNWYENKYDQLWDSCMPYVGQVTKSELEDCVDRLNALAHKVFIAPFVPNFGRTVYIDFKLTCDLPDDRWRIIYEIDNNYLDYIYQAITNPWNFRIDLEPWGYVYRTDGTFPYALGHTHSPTYAPDTADQVDRDYYVGIDDGDTVVNEDNSTTTTVTTGDIYSGNLVDYSTSTFYDIVNDRSLNIGSLEYSPGDKTYYLTATDSHDTTYNYSYTYNITNTSITYIGATAEETKTYEFYYQLPDGRNSADLTNEDIEILALGYNAINYGKSATDTNIRSLYHFDADIEDSSYFSEDTSFTWNTGASITYLESNAFNGCLYLDELTHDFTLGLPSRLGSGDFTLQFRYYQQHTDQTGFNNAIFLSGYDVFQFSGTQMRLVSGTSHEIPTGTWNEIALIRSNGTLYLYLNGVAIASRTDSIVYGNTITFHFDAASACFKYLDELRVLNIAYYDDGASYTPTSVPFDSNAVLVLPDQPVPVADGYWDIQSSGTNLVSGLDMDVGLNLVQANAGTPYSSGISAQKFVIGKKSSSAAVTVSSFPNFTRVTGAVSLPSFSSSTEISDYTGYGYYGLCLPLFFHPDYGSDSRWPGYTEASGNYTFSLVDIDGNVYSLTFDSSKSGVSRTVKSTFSWGYILFSNRYSNESGFMSTQVIQIVPKNGQSIDIVHVELVKGSSTDLSAEYVTVRYPDIDIKAQTIAVRSDIPVEGHQLGGVRPSIPYRGLVWFYVIDGRIRDTQIYTGYAWQSVDSRIWTGERWIPSSSYDILLMQDLFDVSDAEGVIVIVSDENFWKWFVEAWTSFRAELIDILNKIAGGAPEHNETTNIYVDVNYDIDVDNNVTLKDVTADSSGGLADILKYFWDLVFREAVADSSGIMTDFRDSFDDSPENSDSVFSIFTYESEELWL